MFDAAYAIAKDLSEFADRITVVYSNSYDTDEAGPGRWIKTSQAKYFGPKFRLLLDQVPEDAALLLIQADAKCDDWRGLYQRCVTAFRQEGNLGLWSPSMTNTPFTTAVVATRRLMTEGLVEALQCDAIVLGLDAKVLNRLRQFDYTANNLGWGIDWAAISFAATQGLIVSRDLSVRVLHPKDRGYSSAEAEVQMYRFLLQLTPEERIHFEDVNQRIHLIVAARDGRMHFSTGSPEGNRLMNMADGNFSKDVMQCVKFLYLTQGKIIVSPADPYAPISLSYDGKTKSIDTFYEQPLPMILDFGIPDGAGQYYADVVTGDFWSCPNQSTASIVVPKGSAQMHIPLTDVIELSEDVGDVHLVMGIAVHRAHADLLIEWHDVSDPEVRKEVYIKFDRTFSGERKDGAYQNVAVRIPGANAPRHVSVTLCYWGHDGDNEQPSVIFATRPMIQATIEAESAIKEVVAFNDDPARTATRSFWATIDQITDGVVLHIGDDSFTLIEKPDNAFQFKVQNGELIASASSPCPVTLFLNGRATRCLWLGPEISNLMLPESLLSEAQSSIEIRDVTGNLVYARIEPKPKVAAPVAVDALQDAMRHPDAWAIDRLFDVEFYLTGFGASVRPVDPASHYLTVGWLEGHEPASWFSTRHYLARHPDVANAAMNPFLHYCAAGEKEGRALPKLGRQNKDDVYAAQAFAVAPGPHFEHFDPTIGIGRRKRAKVLAYYLPQFHRVDVNDKSWGDGFTEWRNLPRAMPRFMGHIQPRIPRDLGSYDLSEGDAMRRQIEMAKAAGLHGFCFYHYWFDGERVLETPMERLLADPSLDFPFCLMWANENWTRTWDGSDKEIILGQSYARSDDEAFIDDLARHMKDPRYIRIDGRPLFFIYRPAAIPESSVTIARWREMIFSRYGLKPLIMMAQGFGDIDPRSHGLDGAIEFPPHKICQNQPAINHEVGLLDTAYTGHIIDYDTTVQRSVDEAVANYPLIRTVTPTWDNEARRPGRGMIIHGSTPAKFEGWVDQMIGYATAHPTFGETFICVNAWNEWAEGAVLEPDVHYGAAYLNALSRALHNVARPQSTDQSKIVIVGHDANINGAQFLAINIGQALRSGFGFQIEYLLGAGGPLLDEYRKIGRVSVISAASTDLEMKLTELSGQGFSMALTNTTPSGLMVPALKNAGFNVVSLIHELPKLLKTYELEGAAGNIAKLSDLVVFPAAMVRDGFEGFAGKIANTAEVYPQGLYNTTVLDMPSGDKGLRTEFGLAPTTKIVLGAGYADLRKGIDRFISTALSICSHHDDIAFLWLGSLAAETIHWFQPEIDASGLGGRIRILGHRTDIARFFTAADVFYLSSREDPFPSVVLEALACGLPVIGHEGCGGCDDLIRRHGTLVAQNDPQQVTGAILQTLAVSKANRSVAATARRQEITANYDFTSYVFGLAERLKHDLVSVSAVIPNYKYEAFIGERLRSVFDQAYPLREVIVLDDASPDDSVAEIRKTAKAANRVIDLHINDKNSGSPFPQWRKGVELARGDYVWIAEADDTADPSFVARLVAQMQMSGSVMGFTDSKQMDENGDALGDSYRPYINQIEAGAFDKPFNMAGPEFLARFLAVKNVILNVSGVLFRRDALLDAFNRVGDELYDYSVAGDWRLYAELCAMGGTVSFIPEPLNSHRRHRISVTHALKVDKHLAEIASMHHLVGSMVDLDDKMIKKQAKNFQECSTHLLGAAPQSSRIERP